MSKYYSQYYDVILTDGTVLHTEEPYDLQGPKTLLNRYQAAGPDDLIEISSLFDAAWVKERSIRMIRAAGVGTEPPREWTEKDE